jgi:hypothetical protein
VDGRGEVSLKTWVITSTPIPSLSGSLGHPQVCQESLIAPMYKGCSALAEYFASGGWSHDITYDPESGELIVYSSRTSRQFLIRTSDADCISGSAEVANEVRGAVKTF